VTRARTVLSAIGAALALTVALLAGPVSGDAPSATAGAADLSRFDPGNIISDAVFYDSTSMTEESIQQFLELKGANCTANGSWKCVKDYTLTTTDIAANSFCPVAYKGGSNERASRIISKVAQACGINPQVLIVTLQKEQGVITTSRPNESDYRIAMGYGCPDTAACDTTYYGFRNQLYSAAKQFKRYAANPRNYSYKPGLTNYIQWHPYGGCGGSYVKIENQATAGLYNYTPYRPNQAALDAGYGSGNSCSSYGNRNFYSYFTDWFGSTQRLSAVTVALNAIQAEHARMGGSAGVLGDAVGDIHCGMRDSGCFQQYAHARIYYSKSTGAHWVTGAIYLKWAGMGLQTSAIGYPNGNPVCGLVDGGCYQQFQRARMYYSAKTSPQMITGAIYSSWAAQGRESSGLGYPTGDPVCGLVDGGCYQTFQHSRAYSAPDAGAWFMLPNAIWKKWSSLGRERSTLGYPTSNPDCSYPQNGCVQSFEGGNLVSSDATPATSIRGTSWAKWQAVGAGAWVAGYPTAEQLCGLPKEGCSQQFQRARIYWTSTSPAASITGAMYNAWARFGRETAASGYPTADQVCGLANSGCYQQFQRGRIYDSAATDATWITGALYTKWARLGGPTWAGGYPTRNRVCGLPASGCYQQFQHARIYFSANSKAQFITGAFYSAWARYGGQNGRLGYPTSDATRNADGSVVQTFEHGTITIPSGGGTPRVGIN
jgi:uncharacterized protein with LGFP repeats